MNDPARSYQAARQQYVGALQRTLSGVSHAVWITAPRRNVPERGLALDTSEDPIAVRLRSGGRLYLSVGQHLRVTRDERFRGAWAVGVEGYVYSIRFAMDTAGECFAWHWHPTCRGDTHLHVNAAHSVGGDVSRLHVPTGWTRLEDVLRFAIVEFGVQPLRADWTAILGPVRHS